MRSTKDCQPSDNNRVNESSFASLLTYRVKQKVRGYPHALCWRACAWDVKLRTDKIIHLAERDRENNDKFATKDVNVMARLYVLSQRACCGVLQLESDKCFTQPQANIRSEHTNLYADVHHISFLPVPSRVSITRVPRRSKIRDGKFS